MSVLLVGVFAVFAAMPVGGCEGCVPVIPPGGGGGTNGPPIDEGSFGVGHAMLRAGTVTEGVHYAVWYPVDMERTSGLPRVDYRLPDGFLVAPHPPRAVSGAPLSQHSPNVLVLYSHGGGSIWFDMYPLMEELASHGFVVVAPSHDDRLLGSDPYGDQVVPSRLSDLSAVVSDLMQRSETAGDRFYARLNRDEMGVIGYSNGGMTATAAVAVTGLMPIGGGTSIAPPRITAVFGIDGMYHQGLGNVDVPVFQLSAGRDPGNGGFISALFPQLVNSPARYHALLPDANHYSFLSTFCFVGALHTLSFGLLESLVPHSGGMRDACSPSAPMHVDEAERLLHIYGVAFMKRYLLHQREYGEYLSVSRPQVDLDYVIR